MVRFFWIVCHIFIFFISSDYSIYSCVLQKSEDDYVYKKIDPPKREEVEEEEEEDEEDEEGEEEEQEKEKQEDTAEAEEPAEQTGQ